MRGRVAEVVVPLRQVVGRGCEGVAGQGEVECHVVVEEAGVARRSAEEGQRVVQRVVVEEELAVLRWCAWCWRVDREAVWRVRVGGRCGASGSASQRLWLLSCSCVPRPVWGSTVCAPPLCAEGLPPAVCVPRPPQTIQQPSASPRVGGL